MIATNYEPRVSSFHFATPLPLHTAHGVYALVPPPEFVREIWREGSIVEYYRKYGRFPGESEGAGLQGSGSPAP